MRENIAVFSQGSLTALMLEAVRTSETSVNIFLTTWQYIPEDSKLHNRRCENLRSPKVKIHSISYIISNSKLKPIGIH
jgi:hypothetical protein